MRLALPVSIPVRAGYPPILAISRRSGGHPKSMYSIFDAISETGVKNRVHASSSRSYTHFASSGQLGALFAEPGTSVPILPPGEPPWNGKEESWQWSRIGYSSLTFKASHAAQRSVQLQGRTGVRPEGSDPFCAYWGDVMTWSEPR